MFDSFDKLNPNANPPAGTEYKILKQVKMLQFFMDGIKLFSTDMLKTYAATINEIQDVNVPENENNASKDDDVASSDILKEGNDD